MEVQRQFVIICRTVKILIFYRLSYCVACDSVVVLEEGMVCDVLESDVDIFWQAVSEPTSDDEVQMRDLLIETILSQAFSGSFEQVGEIQAVAVDGSGSSSTTDGSGSDSDATSERGQPLGDSQSKENGASTGYLPYVAAAVGGLLVFGVAYVYGTSGEDDDDDSAMKHGQQQGDTSDDSDDDNGGGWFGGAFRGKDEQAQAEDKQREEKEAAQRERELRKQKLMEEEQRRRRAKKQQEAESNESGGWFGSSWGKEPEPEPEAEPNNGWFGW